MTTAIFGPVVAVGYALFGAGALPGGVLVDRYGSARLITASLAGMGLSFLLLSAAPGVPTIAVALALWGISVSVYHPAGLALISKGVEQRGAGFAYHGMAGNVVIDGGPLLTALLLLVAEWRIVAAALVVPAVLAVGYALTAEFDETAAVDGDVTDGGRDSSTLRQFVADSRALFTFGFGLAMVIVVLNGLFYRGTLTFLPDVLGGYLPPVGDVVQLFDPDSPLAAEFDLACYL